MLPPFLPPSVRATAESLPLITEFVMHLKEQPVAHVWNTGHESGIAVAPAAPLVVAESLPLIAHFLAGPPDQPSAPESLSDSAKMMEGQWIDEERNAFDWQSVADLAVRQTDDQRAAEDWASTNWDREAHGNVDRVASLLTQVARRVRAGELRVDATRGMSTEAALAATLMALLRADT